jgi:predicted peroxiredoxin
MRGLTLIVATGDPERFRAALTLASAHAALGGRTRIYCHEAAVALLAGDDPDAAMLHARGLPSRAQLIATAIESGAAILACQTGLALAGLAETRLPAGVETGGLVGLLADLGDDRLDTV